MIEIRWILNLIITNTHVHIIMPEIRWIIMSVVIIVIA